MNLTWTQEKDWLWVANTGIRVRKDHSTYGVYLGGECFIYRSSLEDAQKMAEAIHLLLVDTCN